MRTIKTLLDFVAWIVSVLLQIVGGLVGGYIMFAEGYGDLVYMWLGMTVSIFLLGVLAIFFRRAITPKNYVLRLGLVAVGTSLPLIIFYFSPLYFYNADYETPPEFPFLATIIGVVCFYILGKLRIKLSYLKAIKTMGYSGSILALLVGLYAFWNWYFPVSLPIKDLEPNESLNMKLENIAGDGFIPDVIRGNYVYGDSDQRLMVLDISSPNHITVAGKTEIIPGDIRRINLFGDYAYITSGSFGEDDENKIHVVDISDPSQPRYLASYNLSGKYIWSVKAFGNYLYIIGCIVCTQDEWDQRALYIMDLADPATPVEVGHYYSDVNIADVTAFGNYAYLALDEEEKVHYGLQILDVANPKRLEKVKDLFPSSRGFSVTVSDNRLYFNGGAQESSGLHIMDISIPRTPKEIAFHPDYATIFSENIGYTVDDGNTTPCGCTIFEFDDPPKTEVTIIDYSDPAKPEQKGTFEFKAYSIYIQDTWGFYWDSIMQAYKFLDISDPGKPVEVGSYLSGSLFDLTGEIFIDGEYGVIPTEETGLYIFDFSKPTEPILLNLYDVGDTYWVGGLVDNHVYIDVGDEIQVLDISNSSQPVVVWHYGESGGISVIGKYAFLTDEIDGLFVYDVSDPASPIMVNHQPELNGFRYIDGFDSTGEYFYVFDFDNTRIFDASDPNEIVELGTAKEVRAQWISLVDDFAFLDDSLFSGGRPVTLSILDLSNPQKVKRKASFHWPYHSKITGNSIERVFIAGYFDGVHLVDFSNPNDPKELGFYGIENGTSGLAMGKDNLVYVISGNSDLYVIRYVP